MKKFLIIFMLVAVFTTIKVNGYQKTGHSGFSEIKFVESGKLLVDIKSKEIEEAYEIMGKARFWGWKYHYFNINEKATYIGEIIFSKTNKTDTPFVISYQVQEKEYAEESVSYTGNVSIKASGSYKKIIEGSVGGDFKYSSSSSSSTTYTETAKIDFEVKPYHKLTYRVAGELEVTTCACKYYVFGITFKKGAWEVIRVMTSYYELIEEEINEEN